MVFDSSFQDVTQYVPYLKCNNIVFVSLVMVSLPFTDLLSFIRCSLTRQSFKATSALLAVAHSFALLLPVAGLLTLVTVLLRLVEDLSVSSREAPAVEQGYS